MRIYDKREEKRSNNEDSLETKIRISFSAQATKYWKKEHVFLITA